MSLFCFVSFLICSPPLIKVKAANDDRIGDLANIFADILSGKSDLAQAAADVFQDDELMETVSKVKTNISNLMSELAKDHGLQMVLSELSASGRIAVQNTTNKLVSDFLGFKKTASFGTTIFSNSSVTTDSTYQLGRKISKVMNKDTSNQQGRALSAELSGRSGLENIVSSVLKEVSDLSGDLKQLVNNTNTSAVTPGASDDTEANTLGGILFDILSGVFNNAVKGGSGLRDVLDQTVPTQTEPGDNKGVRYQDVLKVFLGLFIGFACIFSAFKLKAKFSEKKNRTDPNNSSASHNSGAQSSRQNGYGQATAGMTTAAPAYSSFEQNPDSNVGSHIHEGQHGGGEISPPPPYSLTT